MEQHPPTGDYVKVAAQVTVRPAGTRCTEWHISCSEHGDAPVAKRTKREATTFAAIHARSEHDVATVKVKKR